MARTARFLKDGVCYYVQTHSFMAREILIADIDYYRFIQILKKYKRRYGIHLYAYCLLPGEAHLILHPVDARRLPLFMQGINQVYAMYFSRKYGIAGKVWRQRYKSVAIMSEMDLAAAVRLLEFIPVRRGKALSPVEYPWSSCAWRVIGPGGIVDAIPPEGEGIVPAQVS